jgi:putative ABC transport system substrate-binding protein
LSQVEARSPQSARAVGVTIRAVRLVLALTCCLAHAPLPVDAQPTAQVSRVGVLVYGTHPDPYIELFRSRMHDLGYVEGRNLAFESRYAKGEVDRLPALAAELVQLRVDVIFTVGTDVAALARRATATVPIVMVASGDPVRAGLAASLARPGGNVTGMTLLASELAGKRLELLKEAVPRASRVAVLWNPDHPDQEFNEMRATAQALGIQLQSLEVRGSEDFDRAFRVVARGRTDAIVAVSSRQTFLHRQQIASFALKNRLPSISGWAVFSEAGGLLTYGPNLTDALDRATAYVDRVLKGAKPGELPIEQPTKFELVINLKTAKALGLTIPQSLLLRADEVIR